MAKKKKNPHCSEKENFFLKVHVLTIFWSWIASLFDVAQQSDTTQDPVVGVLVGL